MSKIKNEKSLRATTHTQVGGRLEGFGVNHVVGGRLASTPRTRTAAARNLASPAPPPPPPPLLLDEFAPTRTAGKTTTATTIATNRTAAAGDVGGAASVKSNHAVVWRPGQLREPLRRLPIMTRGKA